MQSSCQMQLGVAQFSVELDFCVYMCVCLGNIRGPGRVGMISCEVCQPVVLQVIADISSFVHLFVDLHSP